MVCASVVDAKRKWESMQQGKGQAELETADMAIPAV